MCIYIYIYIYAQCDRSAVGSSVSDAESHDLVSEGCLWLCAHERASL